MSLEQTPLRGVVDNYGGRAVGRSAGLIGTSGAKNELAIHLTGQMLSDAIVIAAHVPQGATMLSAQLIVDEVFVLAASSVVEIGEDGAEVTNGISLTEANLESTGVTDVSTGFAGEWAVGSQLPHSQQIGIAFSAGSVTTASAGKATLLIEYIALPELA